MVHFASIEYKDNNTQLWMFYNKCSGPLAMVSNICYKISTTVWYCPYIQWMQIGPFCYRIGYIYIKGNKDKKVLNGRPYCINWSV